MKNELWLGANILFDFETGKTTQVGLLVTHEDDATTFKHEDVPTYFDFVRRRAQNIEWSVQPSKYRPGIYVIKGVQNA